MRFLSGVVAAGAATLTIGAVAYGASRATVSAVVYGAIVATCFFFLALSVAVAGAMADAVSGGAVTAVMVTFLHSGRSTGRHAYSWRSARYHGTYSARRPRLVTA